MRSFLWTAMALALTMPAMSLAAAPDKDLIARGQHLVDLSSCAVCHSPRDKTTDRAVKGDFRGGTLGRMEKDVGVYWGPNLTGDKATGLGNWTNDEIAAAIRKGVRPDGRELAKVMPFERYATLFSDDELKSIIAYLRSVKVVKHKAPDPVGIGQKSPLPYYVIMPPGVVKQHDGALAIMKQPEMFEITPVGPNEWAAAGRDRFGGHKGNQFGGYVEVVLVDWTGRQRS